MTAWISGCGRLALAAGNVTVGDDTFRLDVTLWMSPCHGCCINLPRRCKRPSAVEGAFFSKRSDGRSGRLSGGLGISLTPACAELRRYVAEPSQGRPRFLGRLPNIDEVLQDQLLLQDREFGLGELKLAASCVLCAFDHIEGETPLP